jgi:hypothetical protein
MASPDCCDFCSAMDGMEVNLGETYFDQGSSLTIPTADGEGEQTMNFSYEEVEGPPAHPNCLLPGARCETAGRFVAGLAAEYSGPAVEIILANGVSLSVTANHLLLTREGFAAAQSLRQGDKLLYCPTVQGIVGSDPDNHDCPSVVEEIVRALAEASNMAPRSVPVAAEYLHGDGRFCDGNIEIVTPDGLLSGNGESVPTELISQSNLGRADAQLETFAGSSPLATCLLGLARAADDIMGSRCEAPAFSGRRLSHPQEHSLGTVALNDPGLSQPADDDLPGDAIKLGELLDGLSGMIEVEEVVEIRHFGFSGHVYDLQTDTSLYIANGILSSNCRCTLETIDKEPE